MTLGLSMIVKNESEVLARLLDGIAPAVDEIVIVDTGSTDDTVKIAEKYTDNVFSLVWVDDFSAARNFAREKIKSDYFIWLDADDTVPHETSDYILRLKRKKNFDADIVMLPYVLGYDDHGKPTYSYYRERIIKNTPDFYWQGAVHEAIGLQGKIIYANAPIVHAKPIGRSNGTRNLDIYRKLIITGKALSPRERYYYARELYYNGFITDAVREFTAFIEMPDGFDVNKVDACMMLARCYKQTGDGGLALNAATKALAYKTPSAELCCLIGELFFDKDDYRSAAYWYNNALCVKDDGKSGAFVQADHHGFIPLIWLAVCYDRLGNKKRAFSYHMRAKKLRPLDPSVTANDSYFASLGFTTQISPNKLQEK